MSRMTLMVSALGTWAVSCSLLFAQATGGAAQAAQGAKSAQGAQGKAGAAAQPGGIRAGGNVGANAGMNFGIRQNPWFADQTVRQQLRLNEGQFNQLNRNHSEAFNRFNQGSTALGRDLNNEQRMQRMRELSSSYNRDFMTGVESQITDPQQRQRFNQLYLQYQGLGAFNDPSVQKQLNLSAEQGQKLNEIWSEWNSQYGVLNDEFRTDASGTSKRFGEMRSEINRRLDSVLNPEQKKIWREMTGESFEFPATVYFDVDGNATTGARTGAEPRKPLPR